MRKAFSRLWSLVRQVLAIRGLLQWAGWWQSVIAICVSIAWAVVSRVQGVSWPVTVAFVVLMLALIPIGLNAWIPWLTRDPMARHGKRALTPEECAALARLLDNCHEALTAFVAEQSDETRQHVSETHNTIQEWIRSRLGDVEAQHFTRPRLDLTLPSAAILSDEDIDRYQLVNSRLNHANEVLKRRCSS